MALNGLAGAMLAFVACLIAAAIVARQWRLTLIAVLLWTTVGYWRGATTRSVVPSDQRLCQVTGTVLESRIVRVPPSKTRFNVAADYTRAKVAVTTSSSSEIEGTKIDLFVSGHATGLESGAKVRFAGTIDVRPSPANPGERWKHRAGSPFLRVSHPDSVELLATPLIAGWRNNIRRGLAETLRTNLSGEQSPLAETLILGRRERLSDSTAQAFRETGTGHLLAISGLHLGLIAWMLAAIVRRVVISLRWQTLIVCSFIIFYAWLVEPRPSVLRATVFAVLGGYAVASGRSLVSVSLIATAALVVLVIDPNQLTAAGAQLSFAAVVGIAAIVRYGVIERLTPSWLTADEMTPYRQLRRLLRPVWTLMLWGVLLWASTSPLAAYHFRWITAWGALLHVLCFPLVVVAMASVLAATAIDLWVPLIAVPIWSVADSALFGLRAIVESAAESKVLAATVAEPNPVWIAGLYATLLAAAQASSSASRRRIGFAFVSVIAVGIAAATWPRTSEALRVTTLSVGHGLCVLIQTPDGHNLLYDVGSLSNADRTGTRITDALRALGVSRIDVLIFSHADQDHFGVFEPIVNDFHVQSVWCHPTFTQSTSWSVNAAMQALEDRGIPIEFKSTGDSHRFGEVTLRVKHPAHADDFEIDNEDSLVVELDFSERRILFTGDIEGDGQASLIAEPIEPLDVMLAPHHGGRTSNTPELNAWAHPAVVVSSSGRSSREFLETVYPESDIYETHIDGAVFVEVTPSGTVRVDTYR